MLREIIKIDEELCNGCGLCIPACPEGALQIIDGKARLVSDLMCDGLGACIGECPEGAITVEEREAEPYNETVVIGEITRHGKNTVVAHLRHLIDHNEMSFFDEAVTYLQENREAIGFELEEVLDLVYEMESVSACAGGGCPGSASFDFNIDLEAVEKAGASEAEAVEGSLPSELRQWPVQMHLVNPNASCFQGADVVLAADCVAFSLGDFHRKHLKGKGLAIACPKLDQGKEIYVDKIAAMIDEAKINSLQVMVMEVPCCSGLMHIARLAAEKASRKVPVRKTVVGIQGDLLADEWVG